MSELGIDDPTRSIDETLAGRLFLGSTRVQVPAFDREVISTALGSILARESLGIVYPIPYSSLLPILPAAYFIHHAAHSKLRAAPKDIVMLSNRRDLRVFYESIVVAAPGLRLPLCNFAPALLVSARGELRGVGTSEDAPTGSAGRLICCTSSGLLDWLDRLEPQVAIVDAMSPEFRELELSRIRKVLPLGVPLIAVTSDPASPILWSLKELGGRIWFRMPDTAPAALEHRYVSGMDPISAEARQLSILASGIHAEFDLCHETRLEPILMRIWDDLDALWSRAKLLARERPELLRAVRFGYRVLQNIVRLPVPLDIYNIVAGLNPFWGTIGQNIDRLESLHPMVRSDPDADEFWQVMVQDFKECVLALTESNPKADRLMIILEEELRSGRNRVVVACGSRVTAQALRMFLSLRVNPGLVEALESGIIDAIPFSEFPRLAGCDRLVMTGVPTRSAAYLLRVAAAPRVTWLIWESELIRLRSMTEQLDSEVRRLTTEKPVESAGKRAMSSALGIARGAPEPLTASRQHAVSRVEGDQEAISSLEANRGDPDLATSATEESSPLVEGTVRISFKGGRTCFSLVDDDFNVVSVEQGELIRKPAVKLRPGDMVVTISRDRRKPLYELYMMRADADPRYRSAYGIVETWRTLVRAAIQERRPTAEELQADLSHRGSNRLLPTVRNWLADGVMAPAAEEDIRALADSLDIPYGRVNSRLIFRARNKVKGVHIAVSRQLNTLILKTLGQAGADDDSSKRERREIEFDVEDYLDAVSWHEVMTVEQWSKAVPRNQLGLILEP